MLNFHQTLHVLYDCIDELNRLLPPELKLAKSEDTVLAGDGGTLDSLSLISLMVSLEEKIENITGRRIVVLEEELLIDPDGAYRSVSSLAKWINAKLG